MNAADLTFGIEIETTIPTGLIEVGGYRHGNAVPGLPAGWEAKYDASIRANRGRVGCEFVSPVLRGADGLKQVVEVVAKLNQWGARVNQSTGVHIHVGFDRTKRTELERLVTLAANFEKAFYASTGTKRRERGHWAGSVQATGSAENAIERPARYRLLNLTNLMTPGGKPTVEFRAFAGTLNIDKIVAHIRMCLGVVERAHKAKRVTNWAAKAVSPTSPIARKGEGQTALTRLFYQLGWIKGRQDHVHGMVDTDGAPDLAKCKKALMKMARKYDAQV